jgi:predicted aldo/keto reductase-like oxidoreductase
LGGIPIERLSAPEAVKVVRGVIDLGINFIDTANGYTDSEEKIGLSIKELPRDSVIIASKAGARDKETFLKQLDLALTRLGADYIDIYQHHGLASGESYNKVFGEGGAYEGMCEAVKAGKVRFPAFSSHDIPGAIQIMKEGKFASVQLPFNYVDDEAAKVAIPLAKELDMGFIAMKPFGGGLLSNAALSIKYLAQFDNIVPDPGIEKLSEMEEIVRIAESGESLSPADLAEIEKIKVEMGDSWCHRCDYCQPCTQGIHISSVLTLESLIKRLPQSRAMMMGGRAMEQARNCTACGTCLEKCPYKLNIPELIKEKLVLWDKFAAENS